MKPPAGAQQTEAPQLDNIQILLQRRAELARTKAKYALTETDAQLLGTHSTEIRFEDGQTIIEEFQDITSVYRIRSGKVMVSRHGFQINLIGKGWFIGDAMLIYDSPAYTVKATMKAQGPVILDQLNLPFVQQLFKIDSILKAKFMRHLVSKYSYFFMNILNDLDNPAVKSMRGSGDSSSRLSLNPASLLTSEISSGSLSRESSSSSINSDEGSSGPSTPTSSHSTSSPSSTASTSIFPELPPRATVHHHHLRRDSAQRARDHVAYKSYPLAHRGGGIQTLLVKNKKIKVVSKSFGFSFKTSIEFSKIQSINKIGENAVTIVYQPRKLITKKVNVFFKNYYDREEFSGLVTSLIAPNPPTSPGPARAHGQALTVPHNPDLAYDEVPLCGGKEHLCKSQQTLLIMKKGEKVLEEGDLFQRVYTLLKGHLTIYQKGKAVCTMEEGDVFGVATLLYMRPCPITIEVASETAELVYIPAYKLNTLLETDTLQAADLYEHAAQALDRQISRAIGYLPNCKRILRERSERGEQILSSMRERSDSDASENASLHSESSATSLRERSDSGVSEGVLDSAEIHDAEVQSREIQQEVVA